MIRTPGDDMETKELFIDLADRSEAILTVPAGRPLWAGVVLAHGLANDMHHPLLAACAGVLGARGYSTLRFNFPYRRRGEDLPDPPEVLIGSLRQALEALGRHAPRPLKKLVVGGKSLGGRMAITAVSQGAIEASALVLLGYPLHPPGREEELRDGPLRAVEVPMLIFAGTRDPFCNLAVLERVLGETKAPWTLETVPGGDHSFVPPLGDDRTEGEIYRWIGERTARWLEDLFGKEKTD